MPREITLYGHGLWAQIMGTDLQKGDPWPVLCYEKLRSTDSSNTLKGITRAIICGRYSATKRSEAVFFA
jgi:hypothetical protein